VKKPGTGNSTTIEDFMPGLGPKTFTPNQEIVVEGTMKIPADPCGVGKPTCDWTALGTYQMLTGGVAGAAPAGWIIDKSVQTFKVGAAPAGNGSGTPNTTVSNAPPVSTAPAAKTTPPAPTAKMNKEMVFFDFNSFAVKPAYTADLTRVLTFMKANPTVIVTLEGNTDNIGAESFNANLGLQRANAVKAYLVGKGIAANRFTVISNGETKPLETNKTAVGRYRNRRVEIFTP
jgi:OOP family OmpA-OmpF porin